MPSHQLVPAAAEAATGGRCALLVGEPAERALAILASIDARAVGQRLPGATHPPLTERRRGHGTTSFSAARCSCVINRLRICLR